METNPKSTVNSSYRREAHGEKKGGGTYAFVTQKPPRRYHMA